MRDSEGKAMYALASELFPICRSITGNGVRETLRILKAHLPGLTIHEVPTGTQVFDWTVPKEWNIRDAYVMDEQGEKIIDFKRNNLHVVGYSTPVNATLSLEELDEHLHSLPEQPEAIPFVTSYYKERWGFCITHEQRTKLAKGTYRVVIDSELTDGSLTYGELLIPGESKKEVFISTYDCHPSMANNELSGPVVTTFLAKWLASAPRRYSYRIIIIPETIGAITYLSKNLEAMKRDTVAGFVMNCMGDDRMYSFMPSREGNTLADRAALNILRSEHPAFLHMSYLERGSDERQYCSPGVDLPVVSIMRSAYGHYPEYHTSLDNLDFVSPQGLAGALQTMEAVIELIERNKTYRSTVLGEPQMGKRGLYPTISQKHSADDVWPMMNVLGHADGTRDVIALSDHVGVPAEKIYGMLEKLLQASLLEETP